MRESKRERKRKNQMYKKLSVLLAAIVICLLCGNGAAEQIFREDKAGASAEAFVETPAGDDDEPGQVEGELEIHFIDVGQGDATLLLCDGQAMLIDAGDNSKGTAVQLYLQKRGVTKLDYMIGTHPDADHIGGMDVVLTKFECETVIMPDMEKDTATYRDVAEAMRYRRIENTLPVVGDTYSLGNAVFTIIAPNGDYGDDANNNSVGILVSHGENRFLFTGDAETEAEADLAANGIDLSAQVYQAGHHGSSTASSELLLDQVNPLYAVISCGEDNSYGHPHAEVLNRFRERGIQVFRTDEQGSIIAVSEGKEIAFNCAPTDSWKSGEGKKVDQD